jgi:hypothetical protein
LDDWLQTVRAETLLVPSLLVDGMISTWLNGKHIVCHAWTIFSWAIRLTQLLDNMVHFLIPSINTLDKKACK